MTGSMVLPLAGSKPLLSDPATCGEDNVHNLARATRIASTLCDGCADYHITISVTRLVGRSAWIRAARPALIGFVRELLVSRAADSDEPIDIVIAGAADTSVLSTCAHAAFTAGETIFRRVRYTVLDRCRTPLELCRDFAAVHGLPLATAAVDLTRVSTSYPADLIVLHNILTFLPPAAHLEFLRNCGRWLKPRSRIYVWNSLMSETSPREHLFRVATNATMRNLVEAGLKSGQITINEPIETFHGRLDRLVEKRRAGSGELSSAPAFRSLLSEAGLPILSLEWIDSMVPMPDGVPLRRPHVAAVLGTPSSGEHTDR